MAGLPTRRRCLHTLAALPLSSSVLSVLLPGCGRAVDAVDLLVAAGWRRPVQPAVARLTAGGVDLRTRYGGSGQLVGMLRLGARCDLLLTADGSYLDDLPAPPLARRVLRTQTAGLLLADGIVPPSWADLLDGSVTLSIARAESAAISRVVRTAIGPPAWNRLAAAARVHRADVVECANDAAGLNMTDAALVWDTTAAAYPGHRFVPLPSPAGDAPVDAIGSVELAVMTGRPVVARVADAIASLLDASADAPADAPVDAPIDASAGVANPAAAAG